MNERIENYIHCLLSDNAMLEDQVTKLTAQRKELSSELQGLIVQVSTN